MLKAINRIELKEFQELNKYLEVEDNFNIVVDEIEKFNPKDGYVITFIMNGKWLNEYEQVITPLISKANAKYYDKYNKISKRKMPSVTVVKKIKMRFMVLLILTIFIQ